jgi:predicted membrane protein
MAQRSSSGLFWGFILILFGVLFLLDNFYILDFGDIIRTFWPLILVAIGIKIIWDKRRARTDWESGEEVVVESEGPQKRDSGSFSESSVFGDVNLQLGAQEFRGGSVSNVFGDIKLDISQTKLKEGITRLYISGVFGDITLVTAKDTALHVRAKCTAGDVAIRGEKKEGLFPSLERSDAGYEEADSKLYIQCSSVFGSTTVF